MRFMHIADVHLGAAPDHGYIWAGERGRELWESFRSCIQTANEQKVDLLLIAGDLFHREPSMQELKEVNYLFSTLQRTVVVLMAGNHDHLHRGSAYLSFPWNENVVTLFAPQCECIRLPDLKTEIYGFSYYQREITKPLYDEIQAGKSDYFKILLAHGGDACHIPFSREHLQNAGFDYIALGHIHKPQVVIPGKAAFAGALEPIDCTETGPHGYILGEVHHRKVTFSFVKSAQREYRDLSVELTEADTAYSVLEKVTTQIQNEGPEHMYRVCLTGERHPQMQPDLRACKKCGRVTEVVDQTVPALHIELLRQEYRGQLIGDYIDSFTNAPFGEVEEKALRYGLEALLYAR